MSRPVHDPVPLDPFSEWCRHIQARYGSEKAAADACHVDARQFRRWARGRATNRDGMVSLGRVDEVLVAEGSTLLIELYPLDLQIGTAV